MSEKEKQELLADISLGELESELSRRKAQDKDHVLVNLPDDQLKDQIQKKSETEFEQAYRQMYPEDSGQADFMYPKMKKDRENKVREFLKYRKGDNRTIGEKMYPSMAGSK
jgi:hypothetical protein